ncbi:MAG: Ig-like domain-containing protein, partial [Gammaproteobacteria bacterium]|nr:Ig-like domain-containing protein [Gammaproteobacteria bacterium]
NSEITATFSGFSATTTATVTPAVLTDIHIDPENGNINAGDKLSYSATGKYSDESFHDLPSNGQWLSSNPDIASAQPIGVTNGEATGLNEGTTNITVRVGDIISNEAVLTVAPAPITLDSVKITPTSGLVILEAEYQFTAKAFYSNGSDADVTRQATWFSDNEEIIGITTTGAEAGYAYALALGSANVSAVYDGMTSNSANI